VVTRLQELQGTLMQKWQVKATSVEFIRNFIFYDCSDHPWSITQIFAAVPVICFGFQVSLMISFDHNRTSLILF
jgi:hypothetical protein